MWASPGSARHLPLRYLGRPKYTRRARPAIARQAGSDRQVPYVRVQEMDEVLAYTYGEDDEAKENGWVNDFGWYPFGEAASLLPDVVVSKDAVGRTAVVRSVVGSLREWRGWRRAVRKGMPAARMAHRG